MLAAAALLLSAVPLRAVDEGDVEAEPIGPGAGNDAASAALNKGYRAEKAPQAVKEDQDGAAPGISPSPVPGGSFTPPAPRQLGAPARAASPASTSGGEGGAAAGSGISCENSEPKVSNVHRSEVRLADMNHGQTVDYALRAGEALTVKFKTPASGSGAFFSGSSRAREVLNMMTVSRTPCDFDTGEEARKDLCRMQAPNSASVYFTIAGGGLSPTALKATYTCILKPDTYYYMSIRNLSMGEKPRDSCEGAGSVCGGYWQLRLK